MNLDKKSMVANCAYLFILLAGLSLSSQIIVPFILSIFVAILCHPMVEGLQKLKIPKIAAVVISVVIILTVGTIIGNIASSSLSDFARKLPEYKGLFEKNLSAIPYISQISIFNTSLTQVISMLDPSQVMKFGVGILSNLKSVVSQTLFITLTSIFILIEADRFKDKLSFLAKRFKSVESKADDFLKGVKNYAIIKTITSLFTGLIIGFLLYLIDVPYFALWGLLAFLLNYIPTVGSLLAAIPAIMITFVIMGVTPAIYTAIIFIAVNFIIGNLIEPRIMGNGLGLSPSIVFIFLIFWSWLIGPVGALLSIPLTMVVKIIAQNSNDWDWLAVILSDKAPEEKKDEIKEE